MSSSIGWMVVPMIEKLSNEKQIDFFAFQHAMTLYYCSWFHWTPMALRLKLSHPPSPLPLNSCAQYNDWAIDS
jgi:hypothetical protein